MDDPLLKKIKQIRAAAEANADARKRKHATSTAGRIQKDVTAFHTFLWQLAQVWWWTHRNIISPIYNRLLKPTTGWLFLFYRRHIWDRFVYQTDEYNQTRFVKWRGAAVVAATLAFLYYGVPTAAGFVWDAGLFAATARFDETIYLTGSQELDAENNVHAVKGCETTICTDDTTVYFRAEWTPFNQLYTFIVKQAIYFPEGIVAAAPPGLNKCVITTYGVRLKFFMRGADLYPDILEAKCVPVPKESQ